MRKKMNDKQNEADNRAVESLLNFETVKAFTAERFEIRRYGDECSFVASLFKLREPPHNHLDQAIEKYVGQQIISNVSQSALQFGQQLLLGVGSLVALLLVAARIADNGDMSAGDFAYVINRLRAII